MIEQGLVLDIDHFATHDGPGIRTAVFLKGCPLSCRWCHSPESQKKRPQLLYQRARCTACLHCTQICPEKAIAPDSDPPPDQPGVVIDRTRCRECFTCAAECPARALRVGGNLTDPYTLARQIALDLPFFRASGGGLTLSGGEPLMQPEFTRELLKACRELGIHTLLETCGFGSEKALLEIEPYCSQIFFDIKLLDPEKHRFWTGVDNGPIHRNLRALVEAGAAEKITVRTPCIPDVNDTPEEITGIARFVRELGIPKIQLLPYNPMAGEKYQWIGVKYTLPEKEPRDAAYYEELNRIAEQAGMTVLREK